MRVYLYHNISTCNVPYFCLELDPIIIKSFNRVGRNRGAYFAIKNAHNSTISNRKENITVYFVQFLNK